MFARSARLPLFSSALVALLMFSATACSEADVVLSVDKLVLSFTRAEFIDRETPCDAPNGSAPGEIPAGTCVEGQTENPELHRAGRVVRKTMTVSNNSNQEYALKARFTGPDSGELSGEPFRLLRIGSDPEDTSNHLGDLSSLDPPLSINANAELELTIYFYGSELGVNNGRLVLETEDLVTVEGEDGETSEVPAWSEEIVLQGDVDCISLGWDQDMDGFCASDAILDTDPEKDCDDAPGPGHQANPGIEEEVCEYEASGELSSQVDSDCDGFVGRPVDLDEDGFCSYSASCIPENDVDAIAELQILCGNAEDDCEDDPVANPNAPFIAPGNLEVCEAGPVGVQVDNNCVPDDDAQGMRWYLRDQDADGFGEDPAVLAPLRYCGDPSAAEGSLYSQCVPTGTTPQGDTLDSGDCLVDCNDGINTIFPGAQPLCDGEDTDCDGVEDTPDPPANPPSWWDISMNIDIDEDNDGKALCSGLDCDDQNNNVVVGAAELCDGADNNCDQVVPVDEADDDGDGYVECDGVPPTAQLQVLAQPTEELVLFASPALDLLTALEITLEVVSGSAEALSEDVGALTVTLTFENGVSTTSSLKSFVSDEILAGNSTLLGLAIGDGSHAWTSVDESQTVPVDGTLGGDCNDDATDPAASAINPGASELNGVGLAICDGQDNDCDGVGHPAETDDDLDTYAECAPSADVSGDELGGELLTIMAPPDASGDNITLSVQTGANEAVTESVGTRTLVLTYVSGTSTTTSLAGLIQGQLGGLSLVDSVAGSGTTTWGATLAGTYTLVNVPGGDCDDSNPEINLAATELCDGFDNNCDGLVPGSEVDQDGDGFVACAPNSGWLLDSNGDPLVLGAGGGGDCEDDVSTEPFASVIYPGAPEIADSYYDAVANTYVLVDNQCPGDAGYDANGIPSAGEYCTGALLSPSGCVGGPSTSCYSCVDGELDNDGDNISPAGGDCDDSNPQVNNQMLEICDGFDNDCDGSVMPTELDGDGDGYIVCAIAPGVTPAAGISGGADCDDGNGLINPGETEIADGFDNDCDPSTTIPEEEDDDGDGVSELEGDCDDLDPTSWEDTANGTSAPEICDELDNDCDGLLGDGTSGSVDEFDDDGDGFTVCDPSQPTSTTIVNDCLEHASQITAAFPGYPAFGADNYPANAAAVHPLAVEVCDGWDTDCSSGSFVTSASVEPQEFDNDNDDFIDCFDSGDGVVGFTDYSAQANRSYMGANDCADVSGDTGGTSLPLTDIYPGAPSICDGWDNTCTGASAPFVAANSDEFDDDGDQYLECAGVSINSGATNASGSTILGGYDCLDDPTTDPELTAGTHPATGQAVTSIMAAAINPGASEVCDGWNTDCDASGPTQTAMPSASDIPGEIDDDADGFIECNNFVSATGVPGYSGDDCLDVTLASNAYSDNVNPAATETCDSWDTDCSAQPAYPNNDGLPELAEEIDDDGDLYIQCDFSATANANGAENNGYGGVLDGSDCLDVSTGTNSYSDDVNPGETEVCDSWDTDCSSQSAYPNNDGAPESAEELDDDQDGYVQCTYPASAITGGALNNGFGGAVGDDDCLDVSLATNAYSDDVNTAASEACDGWDTDCDSQGNYPANDGTPEDSDELDQDGDLYIQCGVMVAAAQGLGPNGEVGGSDCLDDAGNPYSDEVNPGETTDTCDGWDTDCDSQPAYPGNDGTPEDLDELDQDGDLYIQCDMVAAAVGNGPNNESGSDCLDDAGNTYSNNVNPGEPTDVCDGWDTDCSNQGAYPANTGSPEVADELDQDVDGYIQCDMVAGASGNGPNGVQGSDCLDVAVNAYSSDVNPGAASDVCDGWDTDCDGQSAYPNNDGSPDVLAESDDDGDGYFECDMVAAASGNTPAGITSGSDCLDDAGNPYSDDVNPGAPTDVCDGWDTDCDSGNGGAPEDVLEQDQDGDTYVECSSYVTNSGAAGITGGDDCLDDPVGLGLTYALDTASDPAITAAQAAQVNPGASEACDGFNTDCEFNTYLPAAAPSNERDGDLDDYMECGPIAAWTPTGLFGEDCADSLNAVNPGVASDLAAGADNLVDNDCDGTFDEDAAAGSIAVTELMTEVTGSDGQWIEIYNASGRTVSLHNFVFSDGTGASYTFTGTYTDAVTAPLQMADDSYEVLCVDVSNGTGASAPFKDCLNTTDMTGFELDSATTDSVTVELAGTTVDTLGWTGALASLSNDSSITLEPSLGDYITGNDTVDTSTANWCVPGVGWTGGGSRRGSPGFDNVSCDSNLIDLDGDGYCAGGQDTTGDGDCDDPSESAASNPTDCDETNPAINEAATEVCDGWDTDCSTGSSFPPDVANEADDDGDNYIECTVAGSPVLPGTIVSGTDCDDTRAYRFPTNTEVCDGYDNDCSSGADFTNGGGDELDGDSDNYLECSTFVNSDGAGGFEGGDDCNDLLSYESPGGTEVCDGYDNDCSGTADFTDEVDGDTDNYLLCTGFVDQNGSDAFAGGSDCDDTASYMNSGETEVCDGYDNDCSGTANFSDGGGDELDGDSDSYLECTAFVDSDGGGGIAGGDDCDDGVSNVYPGAPELCDAADNDCNNLVDDNLDGDGDLVTTCGPDGIQGNADDDCDDTNAAIYPSAPEICDGFDSNCSSGSASPADVATELDDDSDGYIECAVTGSPTLPGGITSGSDCRDDASDTYSGSINPGASEACDGFDTDCSTGTYTSAPGDETDTDTDGWVTCSSYVAASTSGLSGGSDCDDTRDYRFPSNPEVCDGYDNDCSSGADFTNGGGDELDGDTDSYLLCTGFVDQDGADAFAGGSDCDDTRGYMNGGASEVCDGYDNDCSGSADVDEVDVDGDTYLLCATTFVDQDGSDAFAGGSDCDDSLPYESPGGTEVCDGYDNDCSGSADFTDEVDGDTDTYLLCTGFVDQNVADAFAGGSDCDDTLSYESPGGTEICDGYDNDCSGAANYLDAGGDEDDTDGDNYVECTNFFVDSDGAGGIEGGDDCDDARSYERPGGTEVCDGYDNDCSGSADFTDEVDGDTDTYLLCAGFVDQEGADAFAGGSDCDDTRDYMNGGETEVCDGYDNDCSGTANFSDGGGDELDEDSDDYLECAAFVDNDSVGGIEGGDDCDDDVTTGPTVFPFAGDSDDTDGIDSDCDGVDCLGGDGAAGTAYSTGPYYVYCDVSGTQAAAVTACEQTVGGRLMRLAEILNATDNSEVAALITASSTTGTAWVGAQDDLVEGDYSWSAGANNSVLNVIATYTPSNFPPGSTDAANDCVTADQAGDWFEVDCASTPTGYVCEAE